MDSVVVGISCGDLNGIGLEVALKAFSDERMFQFFTPVIFANADTIHLHQEACGLTDIKVEQTQIDKIDDEANFIQAIECWEFEAPVEFGRISRDGAEFAKISLDMATRALADGHVDALVTAPIHKEAMKEAEFGFPGHTEYLESKFSDGKSLMVMVGPDDLRVAVATGHIPLGSVVNSLSPTILANKLDILNESLKRDFNIEGPMIAVLGLNPHAGDGGAIGTEEETLIRPAVLEAKDRGMNIMGPYPADGFFGSGQYRNFDGILAMYHDQGLVPFKTLAFGGGINFTAGLSVVRTSPDHGTAMNIAGRGEASADSFQQALFLARQVHLSREGFDEAYANPIEIIDRSWRARKNHKKGGHQGPKKHGGDRPPRNS